MGSVEPIKKQATAFWNGAKAGVGLATDATEVAPSVAFVPRGC